MLAHFREKHIVFVGTKRIVLDSFAAAAAAAAVRTYAAQCDQADAQTGSVPSDLPPCGT